MKTLAVVIVFAVVMSGVVQDLHAEQKDDAAVVGTWEGESKCTVAGSPCHDEHVIYEIAREGSGLKIDAYKVVNGEKLFMGALGCKYNAEKKNLSCSGGNPKGKSDWEFFVSGETMQGTLVIGKERTLYRKVNVKRQGKG
jgi:hypothetical protein